VLHPITPPPTQRNRIVQSYPNNCWNGDIYALLADAHHAECSTRQPSTRTASQPTYSCLKKFRGEDAAGVEFPAACNLLQSGPACAAAWPDSDPLARLRLMSGLLLPIQLSVRD
jgi:hypothetical protein